MGNASSSDVHEPDWQPVKQPNILPPPATKHVKQAHIFSEPVAERKKGGQVIAFHSASKWRHHFEMSQKTPQLVVMDFTASWCGPCQLIQPAVDEFAQKYSDVEFVKIDVDELHGVAEEFNVQAMPTFMLMKEGKQVDKIVGAKKDDLRKKIEKHRPVLKMDHDNVVAS